MVNFTWSCLFLNCHFKWFECLWQWMTTDMICQLHLNLPCLMHFNLTLVEIIQADSETYSSWLTVISIIVIDKRYSRKATGTRWSPKWRLEGLKHVLKYIETEAPTTFVLENVPGLRSRKHRLPDLPYVSDGLLIIDWLEIPDLTWTPWI